MDNPIEISLFFFVVITNNLVIYTVLFKTKTVTDFFVLRTQLSSNPTIYTIVYRGPIKKKRVMFTLARALWPLWHMKSPTS